MKMLSGTAVLWTVLIATGLGFGQATDATWSPILKKSDNTEVEDDYSFGFKECTERTGVGVGRQFDCDFVIDRKKDASADRENLLTIKEKEGTSFLGFGNVGLEHKLLENSSTGEYYVYTGPDDITTNDVFVLYNSQQTLDMSPANISLSYQNTLQEDYYDHPSLATWEDKFVIENRKPDEVWESDIGMSLNLSRTYSDQNDIMMIESDEISIQKNSTWSNARAKYGVYGLEVSSNGNFANVSPSSISISGNGNYAEFTPEQISVKTVRTTSWKPIPDYVFEEDYKLPSLSSVESYIKEHKHLPEIPSAVEMERDGIDIGTMNMNLLKKIEEMTLHMIRMEKEINALKAAAK